MARHGGPCSPDREAEAAAPLGLGQLHLADRDPRLARSPDGDQAGGIAGEPRQEQQAAVGGPAQLGFGGSKAEGHVGELLPASGGEVQQPHVECLLGAVEGGRERDVGEPTVRVPADQPMTWASSLLGQGSRRKPPSAVTSALEGPSPLRALP